MVTTRDRIAAFPLLATLSPAHLDLLTSAAAEVCYATRERLFFQDEPALGCWLILEGRVAIDSLVLGRGHETVAVAGPGEVVGWSWLVPPLRWRFGAVALTPVAAIRLDTTCLRAMMAGDPEFALLITDAMRAVAAQRGDAVEPRFATRYR